MDTNVAEILVEALPYFKKFAKKTIVIKYGGHAMVDEELKRSFARDITLLKFIGINPVVVHGGGPQINKVLEKMGIASTFVRGMRMTDEPTMDVVEMVLGGKVNKSIVAQINSEGGKAVGLTGKDGDLIKAEKLKLVYQEENKPPEILDTGLVGKVTEINPEIIDTLANQGFVPIIAPVGVGERGETFNINADLVASKIAVSLNAERLILLTDVEGILRNDGSLVSSVKTSEVSKYIDDGTISGGMIPKIECAKEAVENGVEKVHILDGRVKHVFLLELFTDKGIGTQVTGE